MRITDIRETAVPLKSSLRNAVFDFSEMTTSVVAVITDVPIVDLAATIATPTAPTARADRAAVSQISAVPSRAANEHIDRRASAIPVRVAISRRVAGSA